MIATILVCLTLLCIFIAYKNIFNQQQKRLVQRDVQQKKICKSNTDCGSGQVCDGPIQSEEYNNLASDLNCTLGGGSQLQQMAEIIGCNGTKAALLRKKMNNDPSICKYTSELPDKDGQVCGDFCKDPFRCIDGKCCSNPVNDFQIGRTVCSSGENGSKCSKDFNCKSNNCSFGILGSTCKPADRSLEDGQICKTNSICKKNACGYVTSTLGMHNSSTDSQKCCKSGNTTDYLFEDYCTGQEAGNFCYTDAMCASGNCKGNSLFSRGRCS